MADVALDRDDARALLRDARARDASARSHRQGSARSRAARERRRPRSTCGCLRSGASSSTSSSATSTRRASAGDRRSRSTSTTPPIRSWPIRIGSSRWSRTCSRTRCGTRRDGGSDRARARASRGAACVLRSSIRATGIAARAPAARVRSLLQGRRGAQRTAPAAAASGCRSRKAIVERHGGNDRRSPAAGPHRRSRSACRRRSAWPAVAGSHSASTNL